MNKVLMFLLLTAVMLVSTALTGCQKGTKEETTLDGAKDKVENVVPTEVPVPDTPKEVPAPEKPMDHPAI
jgi:hypothetical protein